MKILLLGNDILKKTAQPITEINDEVIDFARQMMKTMINGRGVGLAAPQVGRLDRFFVIKADDGVERYFFNPEIIQTSTDEVLYEEGCLSIPELWANVRRPSAVKIQAWNEKGRPFTLEATGLLARAIQHEYDHLNGILFIDHLNAVQRQRIVDQFDKRSRK